jgi:two-component system CheB/CheR fusion protein
MPSNSTKRKYNAEELAQSPLVVGIVASAGGLEAFRIFFSRMPADSGMAFVLVQHLAPDHLSLLVELLEKTTKMPVQEAETGMPVQANHVYIIPPNATLLIEKGQLVVMRPAPPREDRYPIDTFFFSLAKDQGENAVCIVLSGTGNDGSLGLTSVKEQGGLTIAQAVSDHVPMAGMPSNAAATGYVDYVLPVEDIPAKLIMYQQHMSTVTPQKDEEGIRKDTLSYLPEIFQLLRTHVGHDFSCYKEKSVIRRIQRRMQVLHITTIQDYIEILTKQPKELEFLFQELLIGVTQFFRDPEAFKTLEEKVIPKLLEGKGADSQVRIWTVACATGEEAYSIAILLAEAIQNMPASPKVLIFATDIDEQAVTFARSGRYAKSQLESIPPDRLQRWFTKEGDYYVVSPQVREMCIFSVHSVIKDPPFSKIDLISCRNLLIYLDIVLQEHVIPIFHYALRSGGFLFLGASEGIGRRSDLFSPLDEKHRLFERRDEVSRSLPYFPLFAAGSGLIAKAEPTPVGNPQNILERGARRVMERYSPAHVVIDRHQQVMSFSGQTGKYLDPSPGAASLDLFHLIQRDLRTTIRSLLQEAFKTQQRVVKEHIPFEANGVSDTVTIIVEPIIQASGQATHYIVIFQPVESIEILENEVQAEVNHPIIEHLESELRATRARLEAALDQAEEANEDLRAVNEELQSTNEELNASNEELETSKEEMQSMNEELQTVNTELSEKNSQLVRVNNDLNNILESTEIATLFLDENLCVRNFTRSITQIFHLRENDIGRPVIEIANRLNYEDLEVDVRKTLQLMTVTQRELKLTEADKTFLMHIRPYRTTIKTVEGVVITFVDISDRKRHEEALARLAAIVESSQDAILGHYPNGIITSWNTGAEKIFGYKAEEAIGQSITILVDKRRFVEILELLQKIQRGEHVAAFPICCFTKNGQPIDVTLTISPILNSEGAVVFASTIVRDMTEYIRADKQKDLLLAELDHRVKNTLATIQSIARQSIKGAKSLHEFYETFEARLMAVSRTHNLLKESNWNSALLRQILIAELSPFGDSRFTLEGDNLAVNPRQALALALAVHELATNAAKYGAFSNATGLVEVSWTLEAQDSQKRLRLVWAETGGPKVLKPQSKGFGTQLIERSLASEKQSEVQIDFEPEGVRCIMQFLLDQEDS